MTWPRCSPDLNPIKHLRSILKRGIYEGDEQFTSKSVICNKIVDVGRGITSFQTKQLTSSVDKGVFKLILKNGRYGNKYIIYMKLNLRKVYFIFFSYYLTFTENSIQYIWHCFLDCPKTLF